jgi:glycosyltransferase involved in cell wall biosynthesis
MGCPVVVPAIGCLPELVDPEIGTTYDPSNAEALGQALAQARQYDLTSCRGAAISRMRELRWEDIARRTLEAYRAP